jgi:hypothetical protein
VTIIGAGMAGLLAARMLQHRYRPSILERSPALPHNHSAVLRFASSKVSEVLGIPFKKVQMVKTVIPWRNPVADAMAYSRKVMGEYRTDRSVILPERWQSNERYIAPENLIEQMADGVKITFGHNYGFATDMPKVISTIPMPSLAKTMGYRDLGWKWLDGQNVVTRVKNCEAYCTVMVPNPEVPFYRATITGDQLVIEHAFQSADGLDPTEVLADQLLVRGDPLKIIYKACELLGVRERCEDFTVVKQSYAKIAPIDEAERRNFIYYASTETGRAYQLGRFATWRPKLLLDDLVHDVRVIEGWMTSASSSYDQQMYERRVP